MGGGRVAIVILPTAPRQAAPRHTLLLPHILSRFTYVTLNLRLRHTYGRRRLATFLLDNAVVRRVAVEETVWRANFAATYYVIVLQGRLRLLCNGQVIEDCVPGSCVGFLFMFASSRGAYSSASHTVTPRHTPSHPVTPCNGRM